MTGPDPDPGTTVLTWVGTFGNPLDWDDLPWLRSLTDLPLVLKGICHPDDARRALDGGVDGIYCSNHGGRQANGGGCGRSTGCPASSTRCARTRRGDAPVIFDSGVRTGADVVKAVALGATAVAVGRPYVYGMALGGVPGRRPRAALAAGRGRPDDGRRRLPDAGRPHPRRPGAGAVTGSRHARLRRPVPRRPRRPRPASASASTRTPRCSDWGLDDDVAGLERFAMTVVEAVAPLCSVVKPQSAFYERFGSRGVAVLERVVAASRDAGALVLLDVKRGDIGSTSQAYAEAYLDPASPLAADAVTVSPFLGFGSLDPFVEAARRHDAGLFVLALTSNPEGPEVQHARVDSGETVGSRMLAHLAELNAGAEPLGSFGAVVGATIGSADTGADLAFNGPILAPGFGAQGGTPADIRRIFGPSAAHVAASSSREVLRAGPDRDAMRDVVRRANDALRPEVAVTRGPRAAWSPRPCSSWSCARAVGLRRAATRSSATATRSQDQQKPLTEAAAPPGRPGLLPALPSFEALQDEAPDDIVADWGDRRAAGHRAARRPRRRRGRPGDLRPGGPARRPGGGRRRRPSPQPPRGCCTDAMAEALDSVQQQARDVCKTPLSL